MKRARQFGDRTVGDILSDPEYHKYLQEPQNQHYKINIQQAAKAKPLLDVMVSKPGYKIMELDFTALEPTVIAECSGSQAYADIYASGKPHDVYLYVLIKIMDQWSEEINAVYNIDNPTKESVAAAKKKFKPYRNIGKTMHLSSAYKAGAPKIYRTLKLDGVEIDLQTVQEMRAKYWGDALFGDVTAWEKQLTEEVVFNGGYLMDGFGRPIAILEHKKKDVMNSYTQGTGHTITDLYAYHLSRLVMKHQIDGWPIVEDWHDEVVWMVADADVIRMSELMLQALKQTNDFLNPNIPIQGSPEIAQCFSDFKEPDEFEL